MDDKTIETTRRVAASDDAEVSTYLGIAKEKRGRRPEAEATPMPFQEAVVIIDFGSQYSRLIARRVRELKVYCELVPHTTSWERVAPLNPRGIILSGGPASVYEEDAPLAPEWVFGKRLPVLGICYGMQLLTHQMGGKVARGVRREYGAAVVNRSNLDSPIFANLPFSMQVWMSHGDRVEVLPPGFKSMAYSENSPFAIMGNDSGLFGLQFHPEVVHTPYGKTLIQNFLYHICGCQGSWTPANFVDEAVGKIQSQVGKGKVLCALSGGVDSAVTAALVQRAVGDQLTCIFVNNGLLRLGEAERVQHTFRRNLKLNLVYVDATERFLGELKGVVDPEQKRKSIGETFIRVFEEQAEKIGKVDFLAQGTLYPDVIESWTSESKSAAKIKTHHNVGGLPARMRLQLVEPLRYLFKDEVREVGLEVGLPEEMVYRQPFPGPGLAIRVLGEVTGDKLDALRACDAIVMAEIKEANLYRQLWQSFAVLTGARSVGVMGDHRTYGHVVAIRAVTSEDAMTADWAHLPYDVLGRISNRIVNEVPEVNRVVFDITSKPPGTIEWE
jgi:GMP synthase (glutamine-hydrolysing)